MCYSAQILADFTKYARSGGKPNIKEFAKLVGWTKRKGSWIKVVPKAMRRAITEAASGTLEVETVAPEFYTFAAVTDDPPPEVAAVGHDRCIVPIREENIDAWLNPDPMNLSALMAILDERPYYEHQLVA
jgi:putative SOS response-associated peptidase YedK